MLDSHSSQVGITEDPDPLPPGFFTDPKRRCEFYNNHEGPMVGFRGLAYAIILRALEDGVNEPWLRLVARFYDLDISERTLGKPLQRNLRVSECTGRIGATSGRLVLTWFDLSPIRGSHLVDAGG